MQNMSAKDAKYGFGRLIDLARSEPVVVEKHGRPVVVVLSVEEFARMQASAVVVRKNVSNKRTRAHTKMEQK
jgi:prevent-host-death family protein